MDDIELLREYAEQGSESAFAALMQRHGGSVYASALRQVRNPQMAEDVTQAVFVALARKAGRIGKEVLLVGWLHRATRFAALHLMRDELRRRERETRSQAESETDALPDASANAEGGPDEREVAALLEEAMAALPETDRNAILLRYWERKSLRDVGERLGQNEEAAKKRVSRGIEKLRRHFKRRGVAIASGSLAVWLEAKSAPLPLDAGLAERILLGLRHPSEAGPPALEATLEAIARGIRRPAPSPILGGVSVVAASVVLLGLLSTLSPMNSWIRQALGLVAGVAVSSSSSVDAGAVVDANFNPSFSRPGEQIAKLTALPDGSVMAWGMFDLLEDVPAPGLARIGTGGTVDAGFIGRARADQLFHAAADGSVLLRGKAGLERWQADGAVDPKFDLGTGLKSEGLGARLPPSRLANDAATEPDGRIVIGGWFTEVNGVRRRGVARLTPTGAVDTSFDPGTIFAPTTQEGAVLPRDVAALARQGDGKWVVVGDFDEVAGRKVGGILRLNPDGSFDDSFASGTGARNEDGQPAKIGWIRRLPDDRLVIQGPFSAFDGQARPGLARLRADGSLDPSFSPSGRDFVPLDVTPDGKVLLLQLPGGAVRRLDVGGATDGSFRWSLPGTSSGSLVMAAAVLPDGRTVVAQSITTIAGHAPVLKWLNTNGTVQAGYTIPARLAQRVRALVPQADGSWYVGGEFNRVNGSDLGPWVRVKADGTVDRSYKPGIGPTNSAGGTMILPTIWHALPQSDDRILISGYFESVGGKPRTFLARLFPDGNLDAGYAPSLSSPDYRAALVVQKDDKLVIASWSLARVGAVSRRGIARLNVDGSLDTSFDPGAGVVFGNTDTYSIEHVSALRVQRDGKILLAGALRQVGGVPRTNIVRFLPDGRIDLAYDPGTGIEGRVTAMALQAEDRLVLGGDFARVAGEARSGLARLNLDGSLDPAFAPKLENRTGGTSLRVASISSLQSGHLVVSGNFTHVDDLERRGIARLHQDGALDRSWDLGSRILFGVGVGIADATEARLVTQAAADGSLLVGGALLSGSGAGLIRLLPTPPPGLRAERTGNIGVPLALILGGEVGNTYRLETSSDLVTWIYRTNAAPGRSPAPEWAEPSEAPRFFRALDP